MARVRGCGHARVGQRRRLGCGEGDGLWSDSRCREVGTGSSARRVQTEGGARPGCTLRRAECAFCGVAVGGRAGPARGLRRRRAGVLGDGLVPSVHVRSAPVPLALFLPLGLTSARARAPVAFAPSQARVGGGGPCVCDEPHVHVCAREQTVRGPTCALLPCPRHVCPSCLSASILDGCGGPRLAHSQALARIRADRCEEGGFTRSWASEGQGLTREDRGAARRGAWGRLRWARCCVRGMDGRAQVSLEEQGPSLRGAGGASSAASDSG